MLFAMLFDHRLYLANGGVRGYKRENAITKYSRHCSIFIKLHGRAGRDGYDKTAISRYCQFPALVLGRRCIKCGMSFGEALLIWRFCHLRPPMGNFSIMADFVFYGNFTDLPMVYF